MADLLLHIGMGKTGSSYLQAVMRMSRGALEEGYGISYPPRKEPADLVPASITIGNGIGLLNDRDRFAAELAAYGNPRRTHLLFSNERLYRVLGETAELGFLPETARTAGFERVRILLFVRDPITLLASVAQQRVKRDGYTGTVEEFFAEDRRIEMTADMLDRLDALDGVETTVRNYSACSKRLPETLADWLGVPVDALVRPGVDRINRSLTRGELELQRAFNRVVGNTHSIISDPLCERLPDIRPDETLPSEAVQAELLARLAPVMVRISRRLPSGDILPVEVLPPKEGSQELVFSHDQLAVVAESIGGEIARLRAALAKAEQLSLDKVGGRALISALMRRLARRLRLGG